MQKKYQISRLILVIKAAILQAYSGEFRFCKTWKNVIDQKVSGIHVCVFLFKSFLILIFNFVNVNRYNQINKKIEVNCF